MRLAAALLALLLLASCASAPAPRHPSCRTFDPCCHEPEELPLA